jgi:hypothetical protein
MEQQPPLFVDLSGSHRAQTGRNANFVESIGAKPLHEESVLVRETSGTNTMISFQWRDGATQYGGV